jgi:uroporphyrinogen-III synthase
MSAPRLFVTREISNTSPLRELEGPYRLSGSSLIQFKPVDFDSNWEQSDWLFFYSKRGVAYFSDVAHPLPHHKIGCIGPQTAAYCEERLGRRVDLVGSSDGPSTANELLGLVTTGDVICFMRADNSLKSVQAHLPEEIVMDVICYTNEPKPDLALPLCEVAVLTSPLNARTWVDAYPGDRSIVTIIAIGRSTSHALNGLGLSHIISAKATEGSITNRIKDLS